MSHMIFFSQVQERPSSTLVGSEKSPFSLAPWNHKNAIKSLALSEWTHASKQL